MLIRPHSFDLVGTLGWWRGAPDPKTRPGPTMPLSSPSTSGAYALRRVSARKTWRTARGWRATRTS